MRWSRPSSMRTRSTRSGTRFSETRDSPWKRRNDSRRSRRSSSSVRQDSESIQGLDDPVCPRVRIDRETIPTEVCSECVEPVDQCVPGLREADPRHASGSVDPDRVREIDEKWYAFVDEDVERTEIRVHDARRGKLVHP